MTWKTLSVLIIFLTACAQPQLTCPRCVCPNQNTSTISPQDLFELHFIDVGQGDAILLKHQQMEMLVDCGKNGQGTKVIEYLENQGVTTLDYLLISHPDSDHLGGCDDVLNSIETKMVIMNDEIKDTVSFQEVMSKIDTEQLVIINVSDYYSLGPVSLEIIQPYPDAPDSNQKSLVVSAIYNNFKALLTGDCDRECEEKLTNLIFLDYDLLKVPHHGSHYGTSTKFLYTSQPEIAVITVGVNNYGHPAQDTLDRLTQDGIITYRTDLDTNIIIQTDGTTYEVR